MELTVVKMDSTLTRICEEVRSCPLMLLESSILLANILDHGNSIYV